MCIMHFIITMLKISTIIESHNNFWNLTIIFIIEKINPNYIVSIQNLTPQAAIFGFLDSANSDSISENDKVLNNHILLISNPNKAEFF